MVKNATGKSKKNHASQFVLAFYVLLFCTLLPIALFAGR